MYWSLVTFARKKDCQMIAPRHLLEAEESTSSSGGGKPRKVHYSCGCIAEYELKEEMKIL